MAMNNKIPKPVLLVVLDGWGVAPPGPGNAVTLAETPFFDQLFKAYPHTTLQASGEGVGLPAGEAGNSEIGHINLGAGLVVYQDLLRINREIADGTFFTNPALKRAMQHTQQNHSRLHLLGLVSSAVVHSSVEHLYALLRMAQQESVPEVFIHVFTDGRDSSPTAAPMFVQDLQQKIDALGIGRIATIVGRYYAMDRDKRWERTQVAYELLTQGRGQRASNAITGIHAAYQQDQTDEFIQPILINPEGTVHNDDAVIFFNFRTDRPRQLTKAFVLPEFEHFPRPQRPRNLFFATLTEYEEGLPVSAVGYDPPNIELPLAKILADHQKRQLHVAESEKFPHVTYFFNGGHEDPFEGEDRIEVPSPKVETYDKKPQMSAKAVSEIVEERVAEKLYDFILVNYANPDMVAHSGEINATIKACEVIDENLKRIVTIVQQIGGATLITADHGNAEQLINATTGEIDTEHNTSPVPFIFVGEHPDPRELQSGVLADVAPTVLGLLNIPKPSTMSARDLLSY